MKLATFDKLGLEDLTGSRMEQIRRDIAIAQAVREKLPMMSCTCLRVIEQRADELLRGER